MIVLIKIFEISYFGANFVCVCVECLCRCILCLHLWMFVQHILRK